MMNAHNSKLALLLAASAIGLTACGGSDGSDGNPGNPGGEPAGAISELHFTFDDTRINDGITNVEFTVTNEEDKPVIGLQKMRFYAEQLLPEGATGAGNSSQWEYLLDETCDLPAGKCPGTFVDHKNGRYSYTFAANLADSTRSEYKAQLAQRLVIRNYNVPLPDGTTVPGTTALTDFMGDSGADAFYSRKIVATESCNACHGDVQEAGHMTGDVNFCASCHTPGRVSDGKEFNVFIHDIHFNLDEADNKIKPAFGVAALENCQSCHVEKEVAPDWANWSRIPTAQSCGSCHTNIDFAAGKGHSQQVDNSNCVACHNSDWTAELHSAQGQVAKEVVAKLGMDAMLQGNDDNTATLTLTITDAAGNAVDASSLIAKIQRIETITNVGPNFPIMGYNPSPGSGEKKVTKDLVKAGALQADVTVVDGKLVYTTPALPFGAGDTNTAFTFIGLDMCVSGTDFVDCGDGVATQSMKAQLAHGTKAGETANFRHIDSVNFATCQGCHGETFDIHKGYHAGFIMSEQLGREVNGKLTVGVDACVTCHTPDGTYSGGAKKGAFEMKLHVVHGQESVFNNCSQCHNDFNLNAFKAKGALATSAGKYTTPITATCTSCHAPESIGHGLTNMGAIVDGDYVEANQAAQQETCFFCHQPTVADHTVVKM